MLTLAQWIARLTKGYVKVTGKQPDGLAKLKIKMEAAQRVKDQSKVVDIKGGSFSSPQTPQEKINWLVKNVDPSAKQTIPPRGTLEAMLKDGREDLIDHFYKMHTKELGKPKINIDTSDLKHPELVKKMMMDKKLKPTLVETPKKKTVEDFRDEGDWDPSGMASGGIAGELRLNRQGYSGGKRSLPKQMSLFAKPKIGDALKKLSDAELKRQMRAMARKWGVPMPKASGGLAQVLGV